MTARRMNAATRGAVIDAEPTSITPDLDAIERREGDFDHTVSELHREVIRTPLSHMARTLQQSLSTQLVAYMTSQSERTIYRWAKGDIEDIRQEGKRRLLTAYEVLKLISHFEAPGVAETWFIGTEPQLDFTMPAKAIREGELEEALAAARSFVAVG